MASLARPPTFQDGTSTFYTYFQCNLSNICVDLVLSDNNSTAIRAHRAARHPAAALARQEGHHLRDVVRRAGAGLGRHPPAVALADLLLLLRRHGGDDVGLDEPDRDGCLS